ncbi:MAG TPA: immunoglobulin-like domain-containing protein [Casimicrobiaceae bacterium]|nr:immunoglobulin-like domain-containing protein [Casimicrobiaceae bacterium]
MRPIAVQGNNTNYSAQGSVAVGWSAGKKFGTGSDYNTLIGYQSGYNVTSGANNILIGASPTSGNTNLSTGSGNIIIGYNISATSSTAWNSLNIGNLVFGTGLDGSGTSLSSGSIGIGTTSPWKKLSVTGTVGFDGLTAGAGAGSLCLTANKEVVYSDNAGCTGSSLRFKHLIDTLNATAGIEEVLKLRPVSFVYNDDIGVKGEQVGFIAEDVAQVDTRLVTYDASGTPNNVKYTNMVAIVIKAIQELAQKVYGLADTVAGFAERFVTKELVATNLYGQKLCLGTTCITESQLQAMLAAAGQPSSALQTPDTSSSTPTTPSMLPVIQINGENPAHIHVGDTYQDLGATAKDSAGHDLGLKFYLNGIPVSDIVLDTSTTTTYAIDYVATLPAQAGDTNGLTSTSTRTVYVDAPAPSAP